MISYTVYKLLHLFGIMLLFLSVGRLGLLLQSLQPGESPRSRPAWKSVMILHGTSVILILVAGFGMLAVMGLMSQLTAFWVLGKLSVWVVMGSLPILTVLQPGWMRRFAWFTPLLGALAAWFALNKP